MDGLLLSITLWQDGSPGADALTFWRITLFGGALLLALLVYGVTRLRARRRKPSGPPQAVVQATAEIEGRTVRGVVKVQQSDDPALVGETFRILSFPVSIGRAPENTIVVSEKDHPVSRFHVRLDANGGRVILHEVEVVEQGQSKRPSYGTYLNDQKVEEAVELPPNAVVRLGKRFSFTYEPLTNADGSPLRTFDLIEPGEDAHDG